MSLLFFIIVSFVCIKPLIAQDSCLCKTEIHEFHSVGCELNYTPNENNSKAIYSILEYIDSDSNRVYIKTESTYLYTIIPCYQHKDNNAPKDFSGSSLYKHFIGGGIQLLNTRDSARLKIINAEETMIVRGVSFIYHGGRESPLFVYKLSDSLALFRYKSFQGSWEVDLIGSYSIGSRKIPIYRYSLSDSIYKGRKNHANFRLEIDFSPKFGIYRYKGFNCKNKPLFELTLNKINHCGV